MALQTTVALLRVALAKIAETAYGSVPDVIPVVVIGDQADRHFAVSIPAQCRDSVYAYIAARLSVAVDFSNEPLMLSSQQAAAVVQIGLDVGSR
jgi:hypothetical protein